MSLLLRNSTRVFGYDVFIIAGQSNASGRGDNNQTFTQNRLYEALLFGNDYEYHDLYDPTDDLTGQVDSVSKEPFAPPAGSPWIITANALSAIRRRTIWIPCALGGASIQSWQPEENHEDRSTLYGSMVYRARQVESDGHVLRGVLWWQGEANTTMSSANYNTYLDTLANAIYDDLGVPIFPCKLQDMSPYYDNSNVNTAIEEAWGDNNNVVGSVDLSDIEADTNTYSGTTFHVHLVTDEKIALVGNRFADAIKTYFTWD